MIAYDIDPSLHTGQPVEPSLDDGFSRPQHGDDIGEPLAQQADAMLLGKSDF